MQAPMIRSAARRTPVFVLITMLLCALTMGAGYVNKARCVGPSFDSQGRSEPDYGIRIARDVCYSDIQYLWIGRDIDRHVFPYVHGGYSPGSEQLYGGVLEYPVLTGMAIYLAAAPSSTRTATSGRCSAPTTRCGRCAACQGSSSRCSTPAVAACRVCSAIARSATR